MSDQNALYAIYEEFAAAWASKDVPRLMELVTDDVVYGASIGPEPGFTYRGRQEVEEGFRAILAHDNAVGIRRGVSAVANDHMFVEWEYKTAFQDGSPGRAHGMDIIKFRDGKICLKQAFRKELRSFAEHAENSSEPVEPRLSPYRRRRYDFLGLWDCGELTMKAYGISADPSGESLLISESLIAAAQTHANERIRYAAAAEGRHHGLGYVILHQGADANWLLMDWWAHGEINCHLLSSSSSTDPSAFNRVTRPLMACVWEMVVMDHERRAWVKHMLCDDPSRDRYLADRLSPGLY